MPLFSAAIFRHHTLQNTDKSIVEAALVEVKLEECKLQIVSKCNFVGGLSKNDEQEFARCLAASAAQVGCWGGQEFKYLRAAGQAEKCVTACLRACIHACICAPKHICLYRSASAAHADVYSCLHTCRMSMPTNTGIDFLALMRYHLGFQANGGKPKGPDIRKAT